MLRLFILSGILTPMCMHAQMSGSYSIDPAGGDYQSVQDAWDDLEAAGVSGPVQLTVAPGIYSGQLVLGPVAGVSSTNRITIKPLNPGAFDVHFTHGITTASDHPVLVTCDHVRMADLHISGTRPAGTVGRFYGAVVNVEADGFHMARCHIDLNGDATSTAIRVTGDNVRLLDNRAEHFPLSPGRSEWEGISVTGTAPEIAGNEVVHFGAGIQVHGCTTAVIEDNDVDGVPDVSDGYTIHGSGITITGLVQGTVVRNRVVCYGPYSAIHVNLKDDEAGFDLVLDNNMMSVFPDAGLLADVRSAIGVRYYNSSYPGGGIAAPIQGSLRIRHNSVYAEHDDLSGVYIRNAVDGNSEITSNSIRIIGDNAVGLNYASNLVSPWPVSHHNNVSMSGSGNAYGVYATKALIQLNTTMEDSSMSAVPHYVNKTNLHIKDTSPNINRAFTNAEVMEDYDNGARPALGQYDIGADEYGSMGVKSVVIAPPVLPAATLVIGAYPNPTQDQVVFVLPDEEVQPFTLHGADGRVVLSGMSVPGQAIRLDGLTPGTYIARFPQWPGTTTRVVVAH